MLRVFKALPVVHEVLRFDALPAHVRAYAPDTITLGWEARMKARARRRSDAGVEFGTALARGTILRHGDVFVLDDVATSVSVIEGEEPVLLITPATAQEWALFAYHIGNSHQPMMVDGDAIVCPDVTGMAQVLDYHRIAFTPGKRRFTPVGFMPDHRHPRE
jgi:urease accessory protein